MLSWKARTKSLMGTLRDVVFPLVCGSCRKPGALLCRECYQQIQWVEAPLCQQCGRTIKATAVPVCTMCQSHPLPLQQIRAATLFAEPIPHIVHQMKYEGLFALAQPLAGLMAEAWPQWQVAVDWLIPVPLHPDREKKRGYNQAALLARQLSQDLGYAYMPGILQRNKFTQPQVGLNAADRLKNVHGAFGVTSDLVTGKRVLLIDDVCTTGATMAAAAQALLDAGAAAVSGYCVARAM